jgi:transcriptional regulator with XRE-family HTH domain
MRKKSKSDLSELKIATVGSRVRYVRKKLALSQTELAKQAGVSQPLISDLEANNVLKSGHVASIAAALGVRAIWLETGLDGAGNCSQPALADGLVFVPMIVAPGNCGDRRD